ncbi:MAG: glycosyltransferase family 2 protein [Bacteroidales bacterium]|nr:glycosyltransferase family 2 protein [Bacteroidales bacterium]
MIDITVAILSYNHEKTIEKAIESVLSQQTSYRYELILCDDNSTDKTPIILENYYKQHPQTIRLLLNAECKGPIVRAKQIIDCAKGRYFCWLDADDYWVYEYKLQRQVEFLEKNSDFVGCFHDALIISDAVKSEDEQARNQAHHQWKYYSQFNRYDAIFLPNKLISRNIIPTASLVFRKMEFHDFFRRYTLPIYSFSWAFQLYIIRNSKFYYMNEPWSVYYDHEKGLSKSVSNIKFIENNIRILKWLLQDSFYKQYRHKIYQQVAAEYEILVYGCQYKFVKNGFLMNWYMLKSLFWSVWWYKLRVMKKVFKL